MVIEQASGKKARRNNCVSPTTAQLDMAISNIQTYLKNCQYADGYWWGKLDSNNTMDAEYLMLSFFLDKVDEEQWRKVTKYIISKQRADGSWGQYYG